MTFLNTESSASMTVEETARQLNTDIERGITHQEIKERRKLFSYNEFEIGDSDPLWKKYFEKFKEPMILLLLASAFVSVLLKQYDDALSITIAILIVVTVAFIQVSRKLQTSTVFLSYLSGIKIKFMIKVIESIVI